MPLARSHQQLDHGEAVGVEIEGFDRLGAGGSRQESHPQINVGISSDWGSHHAGRCILCNVQRRHSIYGILASHFLAVQAI